MKATEGNGGHPVRVSREPIERPAEIQRGTFLLPEKMHATSEEGRVTFTKSRDGFDITYHNAQVTGNNLGSIVVFVSHQDVVTWAKRD